MRIFLILTTILIVNSCNVMKSVSDGETELDDEFFQGETVYSLEDDLVSYWSFDESTGSGTRFDYTAQNDFVVGAGSITSVSGRRGNAVDCSSMNTSNHFSTLVSSGFAFGTTIDFSIAFWIKVNGSGSGEIFMMDQAPGGFHITLANKDITAWHAGASSPTTNAVPNYGSWYHFAITFDRDVGMTMYRNASQIDFLSHVSTGVGYAEENIRVCTDAAWTSQIVNGYLDSVGVWSKVLSRKEIIGLYTGSHNLE